jgi:iron complex outermembrane receptor protein
MKRLKINSITFFILLALVFMAVPDVSGQEPEINVTEMSRDEILDLPYDVLIELPLDQLMLLAEKVGMSMDELLQLAFNKNVSTASKEVETVFESPLSTTVITRQEIQLSGATTVLEALRLVPGMIVREKTNGVYDAHIRGFDNVPPENFSHFSENTISLIMLDGVPVYNNVAGGTFWETLPVSINQIERIDVVRGPSSALYGPNAVSGVVNIVTRNESDEKFVLNASQRAGNYNTLIGDLYSSYKATDELSINIGGRYDIRDRFSTDQYQYLTGQYIPMQDSILNITGIDYFSGPQYQSIPFERAKEVYNASLGVFYKPADDIWFSANGAIQSSEITTVFFETIATPFSVRESNTKFANVHAEVKGFSGYFAYQSGVQNLSQGMVRPVIKYDMENINANLEYNFDLEKISIRPGINYQYSSYNDRPYELAQREKFSREEIFGLFHGEKYTSLIGASIRADYKPTDNLRLIAALRGDNYEFIDDIYPSYQFVASYKINEDHIIRGLYSRANRSAFVGDLHANFRNPILNNVVSGIIPMESYNMFKGYLSMDPTLAPLVPLMPDTVPVFASFNQYYIGSTNSNRDLDLMTMDHFELGYRGKITDKFQVELEGFYSMAKDFDALVSYAYPPDTTYYTLDELTGGVASAAPTPLPKHLQIEDTLFYENLPLSANQFGVTATFNYSFSDKMLAKVFGTYQITKIEDHVTLEGDTIDMDHENTPSFYGGLSFLYLPTSKWEIYLGGYFYTSQVYQRYYRPLEATPEAVALAKANARDEIPAKIILNARVGYKFWNEHTLFIEGKNLLFDENREFGFADPIKTVVMGGLQLNF